MIVSDLFPAMIRLMMGRTLSTAFMAEYVRKGILELTENYKFPKMQANGPIIQLIAGQANYLPTYFLDPTSAAANLETNKVNSFFIYTTYYGTPPVGGGGPSANPMGSSGFNLKFRTIDVIEVLINQMALPIYWTRYETETVLAPTPDQTYWIYMRYQTEHPFPNAGVPYNPAAPTNPWAGTDLLLLPNSWQDILEYQSAMRAAQELNLSSKVSEFHTRLYGDAKFQKSGGIEGSPGLIFQRTSQENRDQTTARKSFRLKMGSV